MKISRFVSSHLDLEVVGLATDGRQAVQMAAVFEPDLVPGPERWLMLATFVELAYRFRDARLATLLCDALGPIADRFVVAAGAVGCVGAATRLVGLCALTVDRMGRPASRS